jgi:4-amino-4-deoxy-L-arabinose transferase-like glycosyltransferase
MSHTTIRSEPVHSGRLCGGVLAVTLIAAVLRFAGLDRQSLWVDEYIWTLTATFKSLANIIHQPDGYPPTMALLFRILIHAGLGSDWWLRFPSALAGTLSVPVLYAVARRVVSPVAALAAAALLAISPMAVWYSQEAGAYSPAMLAGLLATLALLRLLDDGGAGAAVGYAAAAGAGFGLHYYFIFLTVAHAPFALLEAMRRPGRRRILAAAALLTAVTVGSWLPLFVADVGGQREQDRGQEFSLLALPYTGQVFAGGFAIGPPVRAMHPAVRAGATPWAAILPDLMLPAIAVIVLFLLVLAGVPGVRADRRGLLLAALLVPILGPYLNSLVGVGFRPRYALFALPYALLFAAGGLATRRRRPVMTLLAILVVLGATGLVRSLGPDHRREDNRAAAAYIAGAGGGDAVLIGEGADPFGRYASNLDRLVGLDTPDTADDATLSARLSPLLAGRGDLWLVASRPWTEDPDGRVAAWLDARLPRREVRRFAGVTVTRYGRGPQ